MMMMMAMMMAMPDDERGCNKQASSFSNTVDVYSSLIRL